MDGPRSSGIKDLWWLLYFYLGTRGLYWWWWWWYGVVRGECGTARGFLWVCPRAGGGDVSARAGGKQPGKGGREVRTYAYARVLRFLIFKPYKCRGADKEIRCAGGEVGG